MDGIDEFGGSKSNETNSAAEIVPGTHVESACELGGSGGSACESGRMLIASSYTIGLLLSVTGWQEGQHLFDMPEITPLTSSAIASMSASQSIRHQSRIMAASVMCTPWSQHRPTCG